MSQRNLPSDFQPYSGRIKEDTVIKNQYYVIEKLGDGCYAKVYLVQDINTDEVFALKAINKVHFKSNSKLKYMLDKEAKIHRSLDHPNIVELKDYFEDDNYVFFLLEYVFPGEVFEILYKEKGFSEKKAAKYIYQTTLALKHCHQHKVIHRDIKPENLLLNEKDQIKLADFGWATYGTGKSVVGSVHYNSPEMLRYQTYDHRADIWAIGILIYELLCCEQPFRGSGRNRKDKERETERMIKRCRLQENKYTRRLSKQAMNLIRRILVADPKKRPSYDQILADPWFSTQLTAEEINQMSQSNHQEENQEEKPKIVLKDGVIKTPQKEENKRIIINQPLKSDEEKKQKILFNQPLRSPDHEEESDSIDED